MCDKYIFIFFPFYVYTYIVKTLQKYTSNYR